ncbi:HlyC/CorC family transporter [Dactylosporangium aurantiacum]|uniref:HlyC/CorC family transporter n=1 Tax=Dactylosporangium aurantiacum TaxID=35754 RepID=A0A9Q9I9K4_9ACTN|nr:hemolysin family protein [Dactylosporangium aurantiacum]MDG6103575.1 hemolysin family protein [Dactylosporangium aurantiacum]UWZ51932.1 HlyC/CorC family transporter [Dactylosporangium aurantiacum]
MSTGWALVVSVILLALNGFFVAAEFALVASKRHRLEQAATEGGRAAAAALAGSRELSLMLAGAQLGITLCSLGLGALAEPAVAHLLDPVFTAVGVPAEVSYPIAFVIALAVVVFLHMVVGEMAPKSWAISDPERSALRLAWPFRAFTRLVRPLLTVLNGLANACLRLIKVEPQDELSAAHGPEELMMLLESSRQHGTLGQDQHLLLSRMLRLQDTTVAQVMIPAADMVTVPADATADDIEDAHRATGRSRFPVVDAGGAVTGVVHVRDALRSTTAGVPARADGLMIAAFSVPARSSVLAAVRSMRESRAQLAVATDGGAAVGLVALEDLLEEVIGEFDDETDAVTAAR